MLPIGYMSLHCIFCVVSQTRRNALCIVEHVFWIDLRLGANQPIKVMQKITLAPGRRRLLAHHSVIRVGRSNAAVQSMAYWMLYRYPARCGNGVSVLPIRAMAAP